MKAATQIHGIYRRHIKKRLAMFRATGLICSIANLALVAITHFRLFQNLLDPMWNCVLILYLAGISLTNFSQYMNLRMRKYSSLFARILAVLVYLLTLVLLTVILLDKYGLITL